MRLMVPARLKLGTLVILLVLSLDSRYTLLLSANASPNKTNIGHCEKIVKRWATSARNQEAKPDARTLRDLLFFLHVPRTGGRTYFHCFLRKLYYSSLECPRSYDKLRFDPSKPKCRLLVTHDDYSMMSKLPVERTSVVTILRNPVDRVFSTYEFSIEVAARFLVHPNLTSATKMAKRLRSKTSGVSTLDIWPWKYLVPWMREDLFARREARKQDGPSDVEGDDPYDMEEMLMPLHDYINDPIARDIVHNGATLQVAGLTNNSYSADAHDVRHCIMQHKDLGVYVLEVAKRRLHDMLYVGLTEEHRESATMFANVVGAQVISQLRTTNFGVETATAKKTSEQGIISDSEIEDGHSMNTTSDQKENAKSPPTNDDDNKGNMTVNQLMGSYESCISTLRKAQSRRRVSSLKNIAPANFSKEARLHVSEALLQEIKSFNYLDLELYEYAQEIFARQHGLTTQRLASDSFGGGTVSSTQLSKENSGGTVSSSFSVPPWNLVVLAAPVALLVLFIFAFVNARRTSKIKI